MTTLRRSWLLALLSLALAVSMAQASAPSVSVTLTGPDEGWYDEDLGFSANGSFNLDGDTQKECQDGQATVSYAYSWSYSPAALVSGGGAHDSYVTVRYSQQQAGQTYTVSVTYTVTITYKNSTSDSGSATASKDVFIKGPQISVTSEKSATCAGGIASAPHQTVVTATVTGKDAMGIPGATVVFSASHEYYQTAPSFSQTQVVTDGDGRAQTTLTSGDGVVNGEVTATCGDAEASTEVAFEEPSMSFRIVDPSTGDDLEQLIADGEFQAAVIVHETYAGDDIGGHAITWLFRFWEEGSNINGPPDYEGTAQYPYGSISPTQWTTDGGGKAETIYTAGFVGGWIEFKARDMSAYRPAQ